MFPAYPPPSFTQWTTREVHGFFAESMFLISHTGTHVDAHPRPVSPFNWTVFVSDDEAHEFAHINLVRKVARRYQPGDGFIARLQAPYLPLEQAIWVTRPRYG